MVDHSNDVAVIGLACRFPGEARTPAAFFEMLLQRRDGYREVPKDRYNIDAFWHPSSERQGSLVARGGYFLEEDISKWDAPFFSVTAAEANAMDPQQRLLLEVAFECLENAGVPIEKVSGTSTACYIGGFTHDYAQLSTRDLNDKLLYNATGASLTMLSNRLSWFYNMSGPSVTLDTACSSSLVALHLACETIRSRANDTTTALVGGSSAILSPDIASSMSALHFLSPDSTSYAFDARANGYARGEGVGILMLKSVDQAIRDGDTIRAVIRASGCNQDGKTPGITLPSPEAQASLIRSTYKAFDLDMSETHYAELHGTGTAAGDPLEAEAIAATLGSANRDSARPLYIGSVKPAIGHLEAASGVASVIKSILALESAVIPPNIQYETPNTRLRLNEWNMEVPVMPTPWPSHNIRRISCNSFGYGGTNAHVVMDDAFNYLRLRGINAHHNSLAGSYLDSPTSDAQDSGFGSSYSESPPLVANDSIQKSRANPKLFLLSSPEQAGIQRLSASLKEFVERKSFGKSSHDKFLQDFPFTLGCRRSVFQWRLPVVAASTDDLLHSWSDASIKPLRASKIPRIAFIFSGQGAQWYAMGRELLNYDVFSKSIERGDQTLSSLGAKWRAVDELSRSKTDSNINAAKYSQPLCLLVQIALVDLLRHWGVMPLAVVGHSSGEIGAAYAAGALCAEDCVKLAYHRGRLSEDVNVIAPHLSGAMSSVGLPEEEVQPYLRQITKGTAVIACVNSPRNVTVSGDKAALDELAEMLKPKDVFVRSLIVQNAYHSPHMQVIAEKYLEAIQDIKPLRPATDVRFYSSVTGQQLSSNDLGPQYWVKNMVSPVQFVQALDLLFQTASDKRSKRRAGASAKIDTIIEIGPHSALQGPIKQFLTDRKKMEEATYLSMLVREKPADATALEVAGNLWGRGLDVDIARANSAEATPTRFKVLPDIPSYSWNHEKSFWHESSQSKNHRFQRSVRHDLVGYPVEDFNPSEPLWKNNVRLSELPWLRDHRVQEDILFPGAGMICAVLEAARQLADPKRVLEAFELRDISIGRALVIPDTDPGVETFTHLKQRKLGMKSTTAIWWEFTFYSCPRDGEHSEHASGLLKLQYVSEATEVDAGKEVAALNNRRKEWWARGVEECADIITAESHYEKCHALGLMYGPSFQGITQILKGRDKAKFEITIPDTKAVMPSEYEHEHLLHPTVLDACFQTLFPAFPEDEDFPAQVMVPTTIDNITVSAKVASGAGIKLHGLTQASKRGFREMTGEMLIDCGEFLSIPGISISGFACTGLGSQNNQIGDANNVAALRSKICSQPLWKRDIDLVSADEAQKIFGQGVEEVEDLARYGYDSQKAVVIWIKRILPHVTPQLEASMQPHLRLYCSWMREIYSMAQRGSLSHQDNTDSWLQMSADNEERFLESFATENPSDGRLLCSIGKNLLKIFDGSTPPLSIMMEDDMLTTSYRDGHGFKSALPMFRSWFDLKGHKQPGMKILEIGAGTGSVTLPILKQLEAEAGGTPRFGHYTFTDISSGWFEAAGGVLKQWQPYMDFKRLDIEMDPEEQGFNLGTFDVIIASNVIHATKSIARTLRHCHSLLKPGGKLVLGELTQPCDATSMIYGILSGWWLSEDGRVGGPTMTELQWHMALQEASFSGVDFAVRDIAALEDTAKVHRDHQFSMLLSTKPWEGESTSKSVTLLKPDTSSSHVQDLADMLTQFCGDIGLEVELATLTHAAVLDGDGKCRTNGKCVISLLETQGPFLADISKSDFDALRLVLLQNSNLLWVTNKTSADGPYGPFLNLASGLLRSLRSENSLLRLQELHLEDVGANIKKAAETISDILKLMLQEGDEPGEAEVVENDGVLQIARYIPEVNKNRSLSNIGATLVPELQPLVQPGRPLKLTVGSPGMLNTLHFIDDPIPAQPLQDDHVEIEVLFNALNFVDVMIAMGQVPDTVIGVDTAGIVRRTGEKVTLLKTGDRVALPCFGGMRNIIRVPEKHPQKIPDRMSLEEASTIPIIYMTAYQSLVEIGRLEKGETLLVHAAAGGLGQALIQMAKLIGAEVFCTVGTTSKKQLLMELGIPDDHIFSSRDLTFAHGIMRMTGGKGVDVAVNSLAGEALRRTFEIMAPFGRFVEVGKRDILGNTGLEMLPFLKNITFGCVNIEHICRNDPARSYRLLQRVFDMFRAGDIDVVRPITTFDYTDLEPAFRTMQQGKHVGKLVLKMTADSKVPVLPRDPHPLVMDPDSTYLLVGGLGGLGRGQAVFLAEHGAKHLAFISRSGDKKAEAKDTLAKLREMDVQAIAYPCDIADRDTLQGTLARIKEEMPPIRGVIQGAMVLADVLFENMTHEQWVTAVRPKVQGTWNLHELLPHKLDFFVMLSSAAGIIGNISQSNYGAGNTFQDALAHYRRRLGLTAQVVNLTIIRGLGYLEENKDVLEAIKSMEFIMIEPQHFYSMLKSAVTGYSDGEHRMPPQIIMGGGTGGVNQASLASGIQFEYFWLRNHSQFAYLRQMDLQGASGAADGDAMGELKSLLSGVTSASQAAEITQEAIVGKLSRSMMISATDIDASKPVHSYGVDSLVAVEVRNWIFRELKSDVSVFDILSSIPMSELATKIAAKSRLVPAALRDEGEAL